MATVYIVHGYTASPDKHWFPWLDNELRKIGVECHRLTMPQAANPDKWLETLAQAVSFDEEVYFVGHSLGCIAILNFLAQTRQAPKGAVFVSGFYQPLPNLPELTTFTNVYAILPNCPTFPSVVIAALNDSIVPHTHSDALAQHLHCNYLRLPQGGHFLDREGVTSLPEVLSALKEMLQK